MSPAIAVYGRSQDQPDVEQTVGLPHTRDSGKILSVIRSFADATTADLFHGRNSKMARRIPRETGGSWPELERVNAAADLSVRPAGDCLEALKGDEKELERVNDQYRVTFRFERGDAFEVRVEDYHR